MDVKLVIIMRKRILKFAVIATGLVVLVSCGSSPQSTETTEVVETTEPTKEVEIEQVKIVKDLYTALEKGDYKKAAEIELEHSREFYKTPNSKEPTKEMKEFALSHVSEEMQKYAKKRQGGGINSFEIIETEESNNGAMFSIKLKIINKKGNEHSASIKLNKHNDKWWFDKRSSDNWREH